MPNILVLILQGATPALAQGPLQPRTAWWASAMIGVTRPYEWAFVGSAGFRYTRVLVRARYAITFESPGARVDELGICFLCSGPTFPTTTGFLLDVEGRMALASGFGVTGYTFGNVNSRLSFGGLALGFYVGGF